MKFTKVMAGAAALAIAGTTLATTASALGPNGDDGYTYFSICMEMTKKEAIANGVLDENGKGIEDGTCPLSVKIDKIYFDGEEVEFNAAAESLYWSGNELKFEIINHWNTKLGDAENTVFSVEPPSKTLDVTFTVTGMKEAVAGEAFFAGGFATGGNDAGCYTTSVFGNKADEAIPEGTQFKNTAVTGDGSYVVQVAFPGNEFTDVKAPEGTGDVNSTADTSKADSATDSKASDTSAADSKATDSKAADSKAADSKAATSKSETSKSNTTAAATSKATTDAAAGSSDTANTGATAGIVLAGIALAGAAIIVTKKK